MRLNPSSFSLPEPRASPYAFSRSTPGGKISGKLAIVWIADRFAGHTWSSTRITPPNQPE